MKKVHTHILTRPLKSVVFWRVPFLAFFAGNEGILHILNTKPGTLKTVILGLCKFHAFGGMNLTFKEICSRAKAWPRIPSISKFQYYINWRHGHQRTLSFPFILCNFKFHISNSFRVAFAPSKNSQTCSRTGSQGWCTIIAQLHNNCPIIAQ